MLKAIWPYSGHYLPTEENFKEFINYLEDNNVDLTNVKVELVDLVFQFINPKNFLLIMEHSMNINAEILGRRG